MIICIAVIAVGVSVLAWVAPDLVADSAPPSKARTSDPSSTPAPSEEEPESTAQILLRRAAATLDVAGWDTAQASTLSFGTTSEPTFRWYDDVLVATVRLESLPAGPARTFTRRCSDLPVELVYMTPGVYLLVQGPYQRKLDNTRSVTSWYLDKGEEEELQLRPAFCRAFRPKPDVKAPRADKVTTAADLLWSRTGERTRYSFVVDPGGIPPGTPVSNYPLTVAGLFLVAEQPGPPGLAVVPSGTSA